jgi:hypothetical protein
MEKRAMHIVLSGIDGIAGYSRRCCALAMRNSKTTFSRKATISSRVSNTRLSSIYPDPAVREESMEMLGISDALR